jgi:hypothetical protein
VPGRRSVVVAVVHRHELPTDAVSRAVRARRRTHTVGMKTIVKASTAQDFLALVPQLLGFEAEESIVFVAFRGKRSIGAMRYDLPAPNSTPAHRKIATTLVGMVSKLPEVDAVLPVVYTARPFAGETGVPFADFLRPVIDRFEFSGIDVKDALCVAGDGWGSYLDPACPPGGRPLDGIASSRIEEEIPEELRQPLRSIEEWTRLPAVDLAAKERVARRIRTLSTMIGVLRTRAWAEGGDAEPTDDGSTAAAGRQSLTNAEIDAVLDVHLLNNLPSFVETVFQCDPRRLPDRAAALLIHAAQSPALRDVLLMQWAFDRQTGKRVLDDAERFHEGESAGALETSNMMLGEGPRPDSDRIESALAIVKALAAVAPRGQRPPLFCILGWLSWALGRSSVAARFVESAVEIDPSYGFAEILQMMLARGMLPEWAFEARP